MQTEIPVPESEPAPQVCAWCAEAAVDELEIEPPRFTNRGGVKLLKRAAIIAPVCAAHLKTIVLVEKGAPED